MACAAIFKETSLLLTISLYAIGASVLFITTVTVSPFLFLKEVLSIVLLLVVVLILLAFGLMNFEK
jgi:hypothetical protein